MTTSTTAPTNAPASDVAPRRVALVGATGQAGRRVLARLLDLGREPRVLVRQAGRLPPELRERLPAAAVHEGDARDAAAVRRLLDGADAAVSTLGMADIGLPATDLSDGLRTLLAAMPAAGVRRVIAVASTVALPHPDGGLRGERPQPAAMRNVTAEHLRQYRAIVEGGERDGLEWTLFCPATLTRDPAGRYRTAPDALPPGLAAAGEATTRYDDLADAIVRELDEGRFVGHRVGIVSDA
jgi:putative NADH-flavin reductase